VKNIGLEIQADATQSHAERRCAMSKLYSALSAGASSATAVGAASLAGEGDRSPAAPLEDDSTFFSSRSCNIPHTRYIPMSTYYIAASKNTTQPDFLSPAGDRLRDRRRSLKAVWPEEIKTENIVSTASLVALTDCEIDCGYETGSGHGIGGEIWSESDELLHHEL